MLFFYDANNPRGSGPMQHLRRNIFMARSLISGAIGGKPANKKGRAGRPFDVAAKRTNTPRVSVSYRIVCEMSHSLVSFDQVLCIA